MPENKVNSTPEEKKTDAPVKAPNTPSPEGQKPSVAPKSAQQPKAPTAAEKKLNDPPKEPPKAPPAPPTTPPPPPPKVPPKQAETPKAPAAAQKPVAEQKSTEKVTPPTPKVTTPVDPPKAAEKKVEEKKPESKTAAPTDIPKEGEAFSMRLHPAYFFEFLEHPFTINRETKDYRDLFDSIKENGIHDPVYCRPRKDGGLEIMSGHRRHDIGTQLNYPIPTIIVQADDDTARIAVVDGNLHRMDIPTSELARAAKMKMEALTRKAGRRSKMDQLTAPQKRSDQQVAEDMAEPGLSTNRKRKPLKHPSKQPIRVLNGAKRPVKPLSKR